MSTTTNRASRLPEPAGAHRAAAQAAAEPVPARAAATQPPDGLLTREILAPAAVVVLGAIMTILDATIVNVALPALGRDLHTSIPVIQWVPTVYLLAFASVIPLSGWAAGRFGAKTVWLASLGAFMTGSLLAGLSPSIAALTGARVVQGLGGGMIMPLGQSILAQAAGPKRMGRVMSIAGVPMLLAPIFGPLIGGSLLRPPRRPWVLFLHPPAPPPPLPPPRPPPPPPAACPRGPWRRLRGRRGRAPYRQGGCPPGRPGRRRPRPGRHRLVHPDRRARPLLGTAGCAVPDRRRPRRHHPPGHGGRLPRPAPCPHGPGPQCHQRRPAGRRGARPRPARRRTPAGHH